MRSHEEFFVVGVASTFGSFRKEQAAEEYAVAMRARGLDCKVEKRSVADQ